MTPKDNEQREELSDILAHLGHALSISEQRTTRLERIFRWGVISIILSVGLALMLTLQTIGYADGQSPMKQSKTVEEAIDRLTQKLAGPESTLGQMGMLIYNMMHSVAQRAKREVIAMPAAMEKADCEITMKSSSNREVSDAIKLARVRYPLGYYTKCYFLDNAIAPVNGNYEDKHYQAAIVTAMGGVAVEAGVLMYRIRHDSDFVQHIQNQIDKLTPTAALEGVTRQLVILNHALESVPQMTANMNTMTHQMGVMTADITAMTHHMGNMNYSMGSTMGRMGSWMPW